MDNRSAMQVLSERWTIPRRGGMFIKIFVSFPTGQHAILSRVHDKRVVVGSHGIEPRDRKVPLGCFTSDHSKARSLSCILPRVFRVLGPGIPFSLSPTSFGQSKHIFEGWTSRRFILLIPLLSTSSSISSLPSRHHHPHRCATNLYENLCRFTLSISRYAYTYIFDRKYSIESFLSLVSFVISRCYENLSSFARVTR